ncbi:MAG: glycine cleavage system aminomethyltransferase GcvT, partial [Gammaproteobacteria bacterium]|nr:glycine cleavage system aminomethyltransferase GcvT [Gammaproteobacteria bacterium]
HHAVRQQAGVFDVSHMAVVDVGGQQARAFLSRLFANDIRTLRAPGTGLYTCMLNQVGGVIDDAIVYQVVPDQYRVVFNAGHFDRDWEWINNHTHDFAVELQHRTDLALLAVQGPMACERASQALPNHLQADALALKRFQCLHRDGWFIARTGYTGEDGWEIVVPSNQVTELWQTLVDNQIQPCGLGARDSLRLEAGFNLAGVDMDESVTPCESNLAWTIAWDDKEREFIGRSTLERRLVDGFDQCLIGLALLQRGVLRAGQRVYLDDEIIGEVTSGSFSPVLNCGIGFARTREIAAGTRCAVEIRGKQLPAIVHEPPFVHRGRAKIKIPA